jgi:fatty-acid desaturase
MLLTLRLIAIINLIALIALGEFTLIWQGLLLGWFVFWVIGSIVTHKYFTHNAFEMKSWLIPIMTYLPNMLLFGSVIAWSSVHLSHHRYSDTYKEPHNPKYYSKLKFFFVLFNRPDNMINNRRLLKNKWCVFFHKHYRVSVLLGLLLITLLGLKAVSLYLLIVFYSQVAMFFSSYVYHIKVPFLHYRNYPTTDQSYNNWIAAIIFPSEGYHNNHHKFPGRVSNSVKWYEFDFSPVIVKFLEK